VFDLPAPGWFDRVGAAAAAVTDPVPPGGAALMREEP